MIFSNWMCRESGLMITEAAKYGKLVACEAWSYLDIGIQLYLARLYLHY